MERRRRVILRPARWAMIPEALLKVRGLSGVKRRRDATPGGVAPRIVAPASERGSQAPSIGFVLKPAALANLLGNSAWLCWAQGDKST